MSQKWRSVMSLRLPDAACRAPERVAALAVRYHLLPIAEQGIRQAVKIPINGKNTPANDVSLRVVALAVNEWRDL
jgi:hypothetical protein